MTRAEEFTTETQRTQSRRRGGELGLDKTRFGKLIDWGYWFKGLPGP
jgi:hypothetical protein